MAQADYFLKIDGIEGESLDDKHKDEIELLSYHFGGTNHGAGHSGTGSGSGKAMVHDMHVSKLADKSSPMLFQSCLNGKHFPKAVLTSRKAGENPLDYLVITMTNVFISSVQHAGKPQGDIGIEDVTLNFSKVEYKYTQQNKDGTAGAAITKTHDIAANKSS